ncbi:hypothetical protein DRP05_02880 [Archaeoglobales archaeon]|nr:MAG: hypothetical protein DRP05_02880 [Archaeoglobales archaeon]
MQIDDSWKEFVDKLEKIVNSKDKVWATSLLNELETYKWENSKEKLSDAEIRELGRIVVSWFMKNYWGLDGIANLGFRNYHNTEDWKCEFCRREIKAREGYWGYIEMKCSEGPKLCHECFLRFVSLIECNPYLFEPLRAFIHLSKLPQNETRNKPDLIERLRDYEFFNFVFELSKHYDALRNMRYRRETTEEFVRRVKECLGFKHLLQDLNKVVDKLEELMKLVEVTRESRNKER